jgi:hypothetical protein
LNGRLAALNEWGVEIKSIDDGLADFPSDRDGRIVYLCWKLGEDRIAWWHEIADGFAGHPASDENHAEAAGDVDPAAFAHLRGRGDRRTARHGCA